MFWTNLFRVIAQGLCALALPCHTVKPDLLEFQFFLIVRTQSAHRKTACTPSEITCTIRVCGLGFWLLLKRIQWYWAHTLTAGGEPKLQIPHWILFRTSLWFCISGLGGWHKKKPHRHSHSTVPLRRLAKFPTYTCLYCWWYFRPVDIIGFILIMNNYNCQVNNRF